MIIKKEFTFTAEKKPRPLHIYLPDNYESSNERYPVMYFFDGHNLFSNEDATYGKSWGMLKYLEEKGIKNINIPLVKPVFLIFSAEGCKRYAYRVF